MNAQALDRTYEWYTSGPRQRLQPGGTIIIVMTRWNEKDLAGRLIKAQKEPKADQWEVIEFPAIMPTGKPLWPEYWNLKDLEGVKASIPLIKMECTVYAKSNWRRRSINQKRMVAKLGKRIYLH